MKMWLMTQEQHKELMMHGGMGSGIERLEMKGMKDPSMGTNKAVMDSMMAGTQHIRLDVTDATIGKEIPNASANVLIVSPSKKNSSVDLRHVMSHFGGALTLDKKGEYRFTVNVNVGGVSKTTQFQYAVKYATSDRLRTS